MTRKKAIKVLKDLWKYEQSNYSKRYVYIRGALDMAIKALEQTRWVPVSERLPKGHCGILYCDINGNLPCISLGWFTSGEDVIDTHELDKLLKWSGLPDSMTFLANPASVTDEQRRALERIIHHNRIIAWMPLPKQYKAESEEG